MEIDCESFLKITDKLSSLYVNKHNCNDLNSKFSSTDLNCSKFKIY